MDRRGSSRPATLNDVAKLAGVSRSLVSLAIRGEGYVRSETRQRIMQAAAQLDYQPNLLARSLASAQAGYVGVVVGHVSNPLEAEIAKRISAVAGEEGLTALVSLDADTDDKAMAAVRALMAHRVSGVLLIGAPYEKSAIAVVARWVPVVYVGRLLKAVDVDSVTTDHIAGAGLAVDHLVARGARRIAHVDGGHSPGAERLRTGYVEAMRRHGLGAEIRIVESTYTIDGGAAAAQQLFGDPAGRPEAVFAASDLAAIGVMNEAVKRGIAVPEDLLLMGYDDVAFAGTETLSLTTVRQPAEDLARAGIAAMIARLSTRSVETGKVLVAPLLVVRRSTGGPDRASP